VQHRTCRLGLFSEKMLCRVAGRGKGMSGNGAGAWRLPWLPTVHSWASDDSNPCRAPHPFSTMPLSEMGIGPPWFQSLPGSPSLFDGHTHNIASKAVLCKQNRGFLQGYPGD